LKRLAVRALNQYRQRDIRAYLGIRYLVDSDAGGADAWARTVAPALVLARGSAGYHCAHHFKEVLDGGQVEHRLIFLPAPTEALAETALLQACAAAGGPFVPSSSVFSYRLTDANNDSGAFVHYTEGLRARHDAVARACRENRNGMVAYFDIKKFYPSISTASAADAWERASSKSALDPLMVGLGRRLIEDHAAATREDGKHVLTGPLFSHLLANLLLADLDDAMEAQGVRYFRYVDDIILVGAKRDIASARAILGGRLAEKGLHLHTEDSPKHLNVTAKRWLQPDGVETDAQGSPSWKSLIGDLKRLLLWKPELADAADAALRAADFRLPVPSYASLARERGFHGQVRSLLRRGWFGAKYWEISVKSILEKALALRRVLDHELMSLTESLPERDSLGVKRALPMMSLPLPRGWPAEMSERWSGSVRMPPRPLRSPFARVAMSPEAARTRRAREPSEARLSQCSGSPALLSRAPLPRRRMS
jgi:hypothetical protein